ncbi:nuclear pore complex protein Nup107 isoform X2 [Prorops nasuta]|uniref:nuclear pore complex protein Nup107 isoform X2 n=1 Tax=Prorops nasuta TaxID=863751 RepID=UPI0034CF8184
MDNSGVTGVFLKIEETCRDANNKLYYDFLHSIQNHYSEPQVFDTIRDFIQNCTDTLETMRDAPVREGKLLHDLDRADDGRLERRMFIEIRCGNLQKAQALAMHCGQPWRAACLLGWIHHHDPNYKNPLIRDKLPIEGNPNRALWKLCAWELSKDTRIGQFYRAIYASFCGNLQQLLPVVTCWQDALWAYMKTLLDLKVEAEVRAVMAASYTEMPEEYWQNEMTMDEIFKELHASKNSNIQEQANMPNHLIQKYLILNQIPQLMEEIDSIMENSRFNWNPQFIRFLAHLILFLRQVGISTKDKIGVKVLSAYVRVLIDLGDPVLIAFYTATLPQEDQIINYASYLENIRDIELRKKCLTAADDANLNVEAITKLVVENIRQKNTDLCLDDVTAEITDADLEKIDALDWLLFYKCQREEALWQTNAMIRYFLMNDKIDAARKAFKKIPSDSITAVMSEYSNTSGAVANLSITNNLSNKASHAIHEYLSYQTYLDAQEGFSEWFIHYHKGKPSPLDDLSPYATFTEKVAYDHKKAQYNIEFERWRCTMEHHTKAVKQLLFNVLLFPNGGWLVNNNNYSNFDKNSSDNSEEENRQREMESLREICIPKIVMLVYSVMSEMNEHTGCIDLADLLAAEEYQLYKVFSKGKLRDIFKKICESSLILMDQKKDPWGYPR